MKKSLLALMIGIFFTNAYSAENSTLMKIRSIESRDSGAHALFFNGTVPTQNCTYNDRAIIDESGNSAITKTLLSVALTALTTQKDVVVRVDGCIPLNPPGTSTSPHVVKLQIYN